MCGEQVLVACSCTKNRLQKQKGHRLYTHATTPETYEQKTKQQRQHATIWLNAIQWNPSLKTSPTVQQQCPKTEVLHDFGCCVIWAYFKWVYMMSKISKKVVFGVRGVVSSPSIQCPTSTPWRLTLSVQAGLLWCFHNPLHLDMDHRIFNMHMCMHMGVLGL